MKIGKKDFLIGQRTFIMGILNVTPDSFSDGGRFNTLDKALAHADEMLAEGADIIDIGGESTRPGHTQISIQEEISRVVPVIRALRQNHPQAVLSIDTYKSEVCRAALDAGADFINDVWGFRYDPRMAVLAAERQVPCCLMHNRALPVEDNDRLLETVTADLAESLRIAHENGVEDGRIILDPGIGFGKTFAQNLLLMRRLDLLKQALPYPLLLGVSRKSMIGLALGGVPTTDRLEGTLAAEIIGIQKGCDFLRVHDVLATKRAAVLADSILRTGHNG